ncbi:MAG: hypothetical protein SVK54_07425, partial [candidate division WOR-3 bacterium]|nr:hypothetical protein [candidate division WOR-3 bacterium]
INLNNKTIKTISIPYEGQYIKWHGDTILGKLGTENLDSLIIVTDTSGDIVKYDDIKYFNMNENGDYIIMTYKDYSYYKIQFDFFNNNNELIDSFIIDEKGKLE